MDERESCCTLYRLGLCPECEDRQRAEEEAAAYDRWVELEVDYSRELRAGVE